MEIQQARPGMALGPCTLGEVIGRGSYGAVFQAHHTTLADRVAVKVMLPPPILSAVETAGFLAHFRRVSALVAGLHHPSLLPVLDYGEQDGLAYQILPYRPEGSLFEKVQRTGPLPPDTALAFLLQMAEALAFAHSQRVVHGGITPFNVLVLDSTTVQLSGVGLGTVLPSAGKETSRRFGYLAPEQLLGGKPDARSDVYALGAVLFYLLTSVAPYEGSPRDILMQQVYEASTSSTTALSSLPPACAQVVVRAMSKLPQERYANVGEVVVAYRTALSSAPLIKESEEERSRCHQPHEFAPTSERNAEHVEPEGSLWEYSSPSVGGEQAVSEARPSEDEGDGSSTRALDVRGAETTSPARNEMSGSGTTTEREEERVAEATTDALVARFTPLRRSNRKASPVQAIGTQPGVRWGKIISLLSTVLLLSALLLVANHVAVLRTPPVTKPGRHGGTTAQNHILVPNALGQPHPPFPITTSAPFSWEGGTYRLSGDGSSPALAYVLSAPWGYATITSISAEEIAGDNSRAETAFGLLFHCSSPDEGQRYQACYSFEISDNGGYQFWKYDARTYQSRMKGEQTCWALLWHHALGQEYLSGPSTTNRLTVIDRGGDFTLLINGREVGRLSDGSLPEGIVGLVVGHLGTEVAFSQLEITRT